MKYKKIFFENLAKSNLFFTKKFKNNYKIFIKNGKYILSDFVQRFENNLANYHKLKFCIGVGNGLDALTISLKCLNLDSSIRECMCFLRV